MRFKPDEKIFGKGAAFKPQRLFRMARSKAYLFGGVEIRWTCAKELITDETPEKAVFHFPGGLKEYLEATINGATRVTTNLFAGRIDKDGGHGSVEWAVCWVADRDAFLHSYCNTVPTPDGGTHELGPRAALSKGLREFGERVGNRKAAQVTAEDVLGTATAMMSVFIREPEFQGQTKDKLATQEASRIVENTVRDAFDHWLTDLPQQATRLLEWAIDQAEDRLKKKREKEIGRQNAGRKLRLPGKLADCSLSSKQGTELFIVEGDLAGGSAKQARDRERQAILPLRGKIGQRRQRLLAEAVAEPAVVRPAAGARRGHGQQIPRRGRALRAHHHHDRRRRGRRPHRLAADHLLLPGDAAADREPAPVSGAAAFVQADPRRQVGLRPRRQAQGGVRHTRAILRPTPRSRSTASKAWALPDGEHVPSPLSVW